jgi:hypothetical protein
MEQEHKTEKPRSQVIYEASTEIGRVLVYHKVMRPIQWKQDEDAQEIFEEVKNKWYEVCSNFKLSELEIGDILYMQKNKILNFGEEAIKYYKFAFYRNPEPRFKRNAEAIEEARQMIINLFYGSQDTINISVDTHYVWFLHELGIIEHLKNKFPDISTNDLAKLLSVVSNGRQNLREGIGGIGRKGDKFIGTDAAKKTTQEILKKLKLR